MAALKSSYIIIAAVLGVLALILWQSLSQPGVKDLKGNMQEVAMYRNENNTGPVVRLYAVTAGDTLWQEMKKWGDLMPYTKYGTTKVYFFQQGHAPARLYPGEENFDFGYRQYCLASYEKNNMGQVSFIQYPYRNAAQRNTFTP